VTSIGTAGQGRQVQGQQVLPGMPARLYPCTPSRLTTWLDCPRRYRFTYLDRPQPAKGPPWAHLSLGAAVHTALARWWSLPFPRRQPERGADLVREHWLREGFRDDAQSAHLREQAAHWVEEYLLRVDPAAEPLGVERTVSAPTETLVISGRVDRIDERGGALVVVDYKAGRHVPTDDEARASLQLAMYAVAAARTLRRPAGRVELHHLPTGTVAVAEHDEAALARKVAEASSIARDAARADLAHAAGGVVAAGGVDPFAPTPSNGCSWCDFRRHCRVGQTAAPEVEPWAALPT
jgi:hypothetical protein